MLPIQKKFVKYNYSSRSQKPKYIVIHDTGNPSATALNHYNYFNGGNRGASADFFVDSNNIIQIINTDVNYSWAVGDGKGAYGITNSNSCSIELCLEKDGKPSTQTIDNAIELTKYLMSYYGIGIGNVVRHYDASRKSCPNSLRDNNWARWYNFKSKLSGQQIGNPQPSPQPSADNWIKRLQKELNVQGFRDKNGKKLAEDGILGELTISAMPVIKKGSKGDITKLVQELLVSKGYNTGGVDGIAGDKTRTAIMNYQQKRNITVDGCFGGQSLRMYNK